MPESMRLKPRTRYLLLALIAICAGLLVHLKSAANAGANAASAKQEQSSDPLLALNESFREAYARCRQQIIDRSGPIILVEGDNLVLVREGKRTDVRVIPDLFHALKAVSHIPLAMYVMLSPGAGGPLEKETLDALASFRMRIVNAEPTLKNRALTDQVLQRQQEIIKASLAFLDSVVQAKQVSGKDLEKFTRDQGPKLLANAADAAQAELDALDKQMKIWRPSLSEDEWNKLRVVVMGSALPRTGNLAVQYFAQVFKEKGEGKRIIYAEALFDEKRALNLLGTHLVDTGIGVFFFDDPARMHRDLLADAAKEYLAKRTTKP